MPFLSPSNIVKGQLLPPIPLPVWHTSRMPNYCLVRTLTFRTGVGEDLLRGGSMTLSAATKITGAAIGDVILVFS